MAHLLLGFASSLVPYQLVSAVPDPLQAGVSHLRCIGIKALQVSQRRPCCAVTHLVLPVWCVLFDVLSPGFRH